MKGVQVLNGYSSTRVSLWDSLMFGRLAMGFANVRAGTRVLMLVLVQAKACPSRGVCSYGLWRLGRDIGPSFAYSLHMRPVHTRRDRVASLTTCRLHGAAIQRASPLGPGRALTLPCG